MLRVFAGLLMVAVLAVPVAAHPQSILHVQRSSSGDLEVGGELAGLPPGTTRYVRYEDLLKLPQETYTVNDDLTLAHGTTIGGVALTTLAHLFGQSPRSTLIVAICFDRYRTNYPLDYLAAHRPLLVLRVNGNLRDKWPRAPSGDSLGSYFISHPFFKPAFKVLSHEDEAQIPYGVVRLEFRRESVVFGAIRPRGNWSAGSPVDQGYRIARQDCFRCHNSGAEGGRKAGRSWTELGAVALSDPARFMRFIHDPASVTPGARMPGEPDYDRATLQALTAYFKTFAPLPQR
jgi:cytochrome c2